METQLSECDAYLSQLIVHLSHRISLLDDNFNSLKNDLSSLTKQYELMKQAPPSSSPPLSSLLDAKLSELLASEHESSLSFIDSSLSEYLNEDRMKLTPTDIVTHDVVNTIHGDCEQHLSLIASSLMSTSANRTQTMQALHKEMVNEFTTIHNLLNANYLDVLESNNDKANAIQDMLRIVLAKFKTLRQENSEFEDKIIKLIDELCSKMAQMKM